MPAIANWFQFDSIHEVERDSCPEFFSAAYPSKTPDTYVQYRNFMITLYRETPNDYLNATTCRRHLVGDACAIVRVHAFLEMWGLINFSVDPETKPHSLHLTQVSEYNKFCINAANKYFLKNEKAIGKLDEEEKKDEISKHLVKKINFLTQAKRPLCDYCGQIVGDKYFKKPEDSEQ